MGKVLIIESKSISEYLNQLKEMGENTEEYENVYGYSIGETEKRIPLFDSPEYDFTPTSKITNFRISD